MKKLTPLLAFLILSLSQVGCTPEGKFIARTVIDVARGACDMFAVQQGLSVKDVCETEEMLRPYVDSLLSAQQMASAQRMGVKKAECPACPSREAKTPAPPPSASAAAPPAPSAAPAPSATVPKK